MCKIHTNTGEYRINVHVRISVHMVFNIRGYIFSRLWDITADGDLENLAIEKCTARDLEITLLHRFGRPCFGC